MQLLSIEDLATYLGDSKRTIYKYIASGDCPPYIKISAKNIKFDRADVDAWLESKKVYPDSGEKQMSNLSLINNSISSKLPWMPSAKKVLKLAEEKAQKEGFDLVATEHILFGIMSINDCIGEKVLKNLGLNSNRFHKLYEQFCQPSNKKILVKAKLSNDVNMTIQYAHQQANEWDHNYIGTEHLLAGILFTAKGAGFKILTDSDITLKKVQEETGKLIVCKNTHTERNSK